MAEFHLRLNTICPYFTMFPVEFPLAQLRSAERGDWVLDPFCGRGTTGFAARLLGLSFVGVDSSPVASAIAAAKLVSVAAEDVVATAEGILQGPESSQLPVGEFWDLCYAPVTLRDICRLRDALAGENLDPVRLMLRAIVLGILHGPLTKDLPAYLSNQMPRTYATKPTSAVRYWRRKDQVKPPDVDVLELLRRRCQYSLKDMPAPGAGQVYCADSRSWDLEQAVRKPFRWVVTSPPYVGMRTYVADQWLRNWFVGGPPCVEYSSSGQLSHAVGSFPAELAAVWTAVGRHCEPGARMVVRFGGIPSVQSDPRSVLKKSLELSESPWRTLTIKTAGSASVGRRQADQFSEAPSPAEAEFDLHAVLGG